MNIKTACDALVLFHKERKKEKALPFASYIFHFITHLPVII